MRRAPWVAIALLLASGAAAQSSRDVTATYSRDVAPILRAKCTSCHQRDGDAPFALATYADARRRAALIARVTSSGYMPPWKPSADSTAFIGDRRLSASEKMILRRWAEGGAPEGAADANPILDPPAASAWRWGEPDVILEIPAYTLPPAAGDVFRNFVIALPFSGTRHVRAFQFRPRSAAVHHANIRIDATSASAEMDAADPQPGYEGVILHSAQYPPGEFLGWTPGQAAAPDDHVAWTVQGGSSLVVQLHMRSTGAAERVSPTIGLYFTDHPPPYPPTIIRLGKQELNIPAGARNWQSIDTFVLPVAATLTAIQPHSHYRARDVRFLVQQPGGGDETLLHISDWDFSWQDRYRLQRPLRLPAGTTLRSVYTFDNSAANPRNPTMPPQRAQWGWLTLDEMADVWVQMTCDNAEDCSTLTTAATRKATAEDAIGAEGLVSRNPDHFNLRNDAAMIYLELGRPAKAVEHFAVAQRLRPDVPATAFNLGTALEASGRLDEAAAAYRTAIGLDPRYAPAPARLAALLHRRGNLLAAETLYRRAIAAAPNDAGLRCDLGQALLDLGRPHEAAAELEAALHAEPDHVACLINATWLRAAHSDGSIRRPADAVATGAHAVALSRHTDLECAALDSYAAALAADGEFDRAIQTAREALSMSREAALRRAIDERLALYRRGMPFTVADSRK